MATGAVVTGEFAGALRQRVRFERRLIAFDRLGGARGDWVIDGAGWARVTPLPAAPSSPLGAGEDRWAVLIRARAALETETRLRWRDQLLRIVQVERDPRTPDRMRLICHAARS